LLSGRRTALAATLLIGVVSAASPAVAEQPVIERIPIQETFEDEILTEECGVPVTTTRAGFVTTRTFDREGTGPLDVGTVNFSTTLRSGDNTIRIRDVGADLLRRTPDGTLILSIIGQIPFSWNGVLKINESTGEVILEPKPSTDLQHVCSALTA
jgi:hypothetical protein